MRSAIKFIFIAVLILFVSQSFAKKAKLMTDLDGYCYNSFLDKLPTILINSDLMGKKLTAMEVIEIVDDLREGKSCEDKSIPRDPMSCDFGFCFPGYTRNCHFSKTYSQVHLVILLNGCRKDVEYQSDFEGTGAVEIKHLALKPKEHREKPRK